LGKIADALDKYEKELKAASIAGLTKADLSVLMAYDRKTGHLLYYNPATGHVDTQSMEVLRNKGTIQRLLEKGLIFPGGKLTPYGLQECERLSHLMQVNRPETDDAGKTGPKQAEESGSSDAAHKPDPATPLMPPSQAAPISPISRLRKAETSRLQTPGVVKVSAADDPLPGPAVRPAPLGPAERQKTPMEASAAGQGIKAAAAGEVAVAPKVVDKGADPMPAQRQDQVAPTSASQDESKPDKNLVSLWDPQSYAAEQFKLLRTNILYPVSGVPPRSILVTSAMPGEGKSFVAANLAVSIALNINRHVLLIDCDLRKPDIHRNFGFRRVPGLSEYLTGRMELPSLLLKTGVEKLTLLPGGTPPPNPSELVSSEKMAELLEEVKHRYQDRLIVIDSPPPGMAAETGVLARQVDGILLVSRHRKTPREDLETLIERMGAEKILGAVVNFNEGRSSRYSGYHHYSGNGKS